MAVRDPYAGVDWGGVTRRGLTHNHGRDRAKLLAVIAAGNEIIAYSNYYPSSPTYPLTVIPDVTEADIPANVIALPAAEFGGFSNSSGHIGSLGSLVSAGSLDPPASWTGSWEDFIDALVAALLHPGVGGAILNHPMLSWVTDARAMKMLDYSAHVLGIEFFSWLAAHHYDSAGGFGRSTAHAILNSGRRCFLFGASDHWNATSGVPCRGFNRLLLPANYAALSTAEQEQACLAAYTSGQFYGIADIASPVLTSLVADASAVTATFAAPCTIKAYVGRAGQTFAVTSSVVGTSATVPVTPDTIYVRFEAEGDLANWEISFTNPVMFKEPHELLVADDDEAARHSRYLRLFS